MPSGEAEDDLDFIEDLQCLADEGPLVLSSASIASRLPLWIATIEATDFYRMAATHSLVTMQSEGGVAMSHVDVMSLVGTAVPESLRAAGHIACWFVVVDGVMRSGPFTSREAAGASQAIWQLEMRRRHADTDSLLA